MENLGYDGRLIGTGESSLTAAATTDIGSTLFLRVVINGASAISSFGTEPNKIRIVRFGNDLTLTHDASDLILPNSEDILALAGDIGIFMSNASGQWMCVSWSRDLTAGSSSMPVLTINTKTADYTLALGDAEEMIAYDHASTPGFLTIPLNASVAFPVGTQIHVASFGVALLNIVPATGVMLLSLYGRKQLISRGARALLTKVGTNSWLLSGDLTNGVATVTHTGDPCSSITTTLTITPPLDTPLGASLICVAATYDSVSAPSGWTALHGSSGNDGARVILLHRQATGSDDCVFTGLTTARGSCGQMIALANNDLITPLFDSSTTNAQSSSADIPVGVINLSPAPAGSLVLCYGAKGGSPASVAGAITGDGLTWHKIGDVGADGSASDMYLGWYWAEATVETTLTGKTINVDDSPTAPTAARMVIISQGL